MSRFVKNVHVQLSDGTMVSTDTIAKLYPLMRQALEAVEWVGDDTNGFGYNCPWCQRSEKDGHAPDCLRQLALGLPNG